MRRKIYKILAEFCIESTLFQIAHKQQFMEMLQIELMTQVNFVYNGF